MDIDFVRFTKDSFAHILKRLRGGEIVKWGKEINVIPPTIIIIYKYSSIVLI